MAGLSQDKHPKKINRVHTGTSVAPHWLKESHGEGTYTPPLFGMSVKEFLDYVLKSHMGNHFEAYSGKEHSHLSYYIIKKIVGDREGKSG